ncbi:uncharacterized protein GGS22DRAFT_89249 [Annulohypoxylon maeteangense]|uniref:uncharacterized protein n=1 Tax=Annulohypoxylon maeteangense TaxID=1927788 RepID=UPI002007CCC1|nr:uncharacterized protein GGS22DRAFT_89249 [Annulohypoxylon maeteangense]KAI0887799.1 hypothetical protein GGS22DRAFT_89249 [Annulohypoxylon maeteangense]
MEHHSPAPLNRRPSTASTASGWTARTLAGMGLSTEHVTLGDTFVNTENDVRSIPLELSNVPKQRSESEQLGQVHPTQDGQAAPSPQSQSSKSITLVKIWWLEMASFFLVIVMIAALVGTIRPYQNQPLPQWPYSLSINTIVSFYSEVMRAAMIMVLGECLSQLKWSWFTKPRPLDHMEHYDNASRGPWGSVKLLWAIRLSAILPSLGGIMMILSLLLVPLTQQIVQFNSCEIPDKTLNASIPKTNFASTGTSLHVGAGLNTIYPIVQDTMNSAVYESELKQTPFTCPTGNCTFDGVYHSAGWCSTCEDISDQIEISSKPGQLNFTLPSSNLTATAGIRTFVMAQGNTGIQSILGWSVNGTQQRLSNTSWGIRGYGAAECTIDPCIRSYNSTVKGGRLTETLLSTSKNWTKNEYWLNSIDVSCLKATEIQALHNAGYDFDPEKTAWLPYNLSVRASEAFNPSVINATNTTIRPECIYQTYRGQILSLNTYLKTMFAGEVAFAPSVLGGPAILQSIFQEGNVTYSTIDDTFNRVAQALTIYARGEGTNITGLVYQTETCVSVRWGWLTYPLALVLGTMIFFLWTIDHTRRNVGSRQDYKSSPLALLFHRLGDAGSEGPVSNIENSGELQKKAKEMKVVFQSTNDVWRFTEVEHACTSGVNKPSV